jgi:hypothetical protein
MSEDALFLWVSVGDPAAPVSRIEVTSCEHCAALVPADRADVHLRWHRASSGHP